MLPAASTPPRTAAQAKIAKIMSLRGGLLLFPTKQSPLDRGIASGKERPRNDIV